MKLLYLDCFAGISGDMFLGALLDLGVPADQLRAELAKLSLPGYTLSTLRVVKQNITATKVECLPAPSVRPPPQRGYAEIAELIEGSALADPVKQRARHVFRRIGEAEAAIHGVPLAEIH